MENNEYMDMKKILNIISSKKIFIALIILLSLVMSYFYSYYYKKPQYNSSVTVLLTGDEAQGEKQVTQTDLNLNSGLISTYGSIAKSANVLSKVITKKFNSSRNKKYTILKNNSRKSKSGNSNENS